MENNKITFLNTSLFSRTTFAGIHHFNSIVPATGYIRHYPKGNFISTGSCIQLSGNLFICKRF